MQFWNTTKLIEQLKHEQLSQANYKNYYIASCLLTLISLYLVQFGPRTNMQALVVEFVVSIGILITATNYLFQANGGEAGKHLLNRIICLILPISIRLVVISLPLFIITIGLLQYSTGILDTPNADPQLEWYDTGFSIFIQVLMYVMLYKALRKINS